MQAERHHAIAHLELRDLVSGLYDSAGALVADNVRHAGELAAQAVERVTAFDADGLDLDQHLGRPGLRVGHLLVTEDLGSAVLVVDGCIHGRIVAARCRRISRRVGAPR